LDAVATDPLNGESAQATANAETLALSQILLNLPFDYLKYVLEHPDLAEPAGWLPLDDRRRIIHDVIAERETRRLRAVDEMRAKRTQNWGSVLARLESHDTTIPGPGDEYDVLGWKEEVVAVGNGSPCIVHEWSPLKAAEATP